MYRASNPARRLRPIFRTAALIIVPIAIMGGCSSPGIDGALPCTKISSFSSSQDGVVVQTTAQFAVDKGGCESPVLWSSSDSKILSVDQTGLVSAITAGGPVLITASIGSQSVSKSVRGIVGSGFGVNLSPSVVQTLRVGQTLQMSAMSVTTNGVPTIDQKISWSVNDAPFGTPTVSVSASGLVTALSPTVLGSSDANVSATGSLGGSPGVTRVHVIP